MIKTKCHEPLSASFAVKSILRAPSSYSEPALPASTFDQGASRKQPRQASSQEVQTLSGQTGSRPVFFLQQWRFEWPSGEHGQWLGRLYPFWGANCATYCSHSRAFMGVQFCLHPSPAQYLWGRGWNHGVAVQSPVIPCFVITTQKCPLFSFPFL